MNQDQYFQSKGGDAYFDRNVVRQTQPRELPGLSKELINLLRKDTSIGSLCVVGGSGGVESAYFQENLPGWEIINLDISSKAIESGTRNFPNLKHINMSISSPLILDQLADLDCIVLAGVMCWVDRNKLARTIYNIDESLRCGGLLAIFDFFPSHPRTVPYKYDPGIFTYKQNYALSFKSLGIYREISTKISMNSDIEYPFEDRLVGYSILRKFQLNEDDGA